MYIITSRTLCHVILPHPVSRILSTLISSSALFQAWNFRASSDVPEKKFDTSDDECLKIM
jgi:hypothetical protein